MNQFERMEKMGERYGHDAAFLSEVPDYLRCVLCRLVLRHPVQIMNCGHCFCKPCFERVKKHALSMKTDLRCPVDKEVIDLKKVFEDTAIGRVVGDLKVKCMNSKGGCAWNGDLRDLKIHKQQCQQKVKKGSLNQSSGIRELKNDYTLKELDERLSKCEEALATNTEDITFLKCNMHEVKSKVNGKDRDVDSSKSNNVEREEKIDALSEQNQELRRHFEKEIEVLTLKNQLLEKSVESFQNEFTEIKNFFVKGLAEVKLQQQQQCRKESIKSDATKEDAVKCNNELNKSTSALPHSDEIKKLREEVNKMNLEMSNIKSVLNQGNDNFQRLGDRVSVCEGSVSDNLNLIYGKIDICADSMSQMDNCQKGLSKVIKNIESLEEHMTNIENLTFCNTSNCSKSILLQWKLQNYQYHFDVGKPVYSPIFFSQIYGYRFRLYVKWTGEKKENLGLYFKLCRGNNYRKVLEPFQMQYSLHVLDKFGSMLSKVVPLASVQSRSDCYTLREGEQEWREGRGFPKFVTTPDLENYVINDMISIQCMLTWSGYVHCRQNLD